MLNHAGSHSTRLQALDAWRGICALAVAFFHLPVVHCLTNEPAFANLQLCVDFFFVLSGFVLSWTYSNRLADAGDARRFVLTRFGRVWPLHIVVLALFVVLELLRLRASLASPSFAAMMQAPPFSEGRSVYELATNTLFLQSFGLHSATSWNFPAWSVAAEFYAYLVFVFVCIAFPRWRTAIFAAIAVAAAVVLYHLSPKTLFVSYDWGFLRCLAGFFVGCLVFRAREIFPNPLHAATVLELAIAGIVLGYVVFLPQGAAHYAAPLLFAVLIYIFSFDQGAVSRLFKAAPFQKLGLWSYSIYMVHALLFQVGRSAAAYLSSKFGIGIVEQREAGKMLVAGSSMSALILSFVVGCVLILPVAALCYRWIERPWMDWFRMKAGTRTPALEPERGQQKVVAGPFLSLPRLSAPRAGRAFDDGHILPS